MPIAASGNPKDSSSGVTCYYHILPKPPPLSNLHPAPLSPQQLVTSNNNLFHGDNRNRQDGRQLSPVLTTQLNHEEVQGQLFATHNSPVLTNSPPGAESGQRMAPPLYDLRDFSQRRGLHELHPNVPSPVSLSPSCYSVICAEDSGRKSESPNRKRRRLTHGNVDPVSPPPPPPQPSNRQWEATPHERPSNNRRRNQRRMAGLERCVTNRHRRSPTSRHCNKFRERLPPPWASLPSDHCVFQGPTQTPPQHSHMTFHGFSQQPPGVMQSPAPNQQSLLAPVSQCPVTIPLALTSHNYPLYTGPPIPVCTAASHLTQCSVPAIHTCAGLQFPSCQVPQLAPCGVHIAPHHTTFQPLPHHHHPLSSHSAHSHSAHSHHHVTSPLLQPAQFLAHQQPIPSRIPEGDVDVFADRRGIPGFHGLSSGVVSSGSSLVGSPPVHLLQEPMIRSTQADIPMNGYGGIRRMGQSRRSGQRRWHGPVVAPPSYPGFLLHFLAVLSNPTIPAYSQDMTNPETTEAENYEALLTLAERLGDAKPRGLLKAEIEQLPSYRFNAETHHSDQTSCVICMCDFDQRQLLRVLPCNHEFHAKCVDKWLKTNRTCPICRGDASEYFAHTE